MLYIAAADVRNYNVALTHAYSPGPTRGWGWAMDHCQSFPAERFSFQNLLFATRFAGLTAVLLVKRLAVCSTMRLTTAGR